MSSEQKDLVPFLQVGEAAVLHLNPWQDAGARHRTILRGWYPESHLIFDRPVQDGHCVSLQKGEGCVIRYVTQGRALGFNSVILEYDLRQEKPTCMVLWPKAFEMFSFRRYERIVLTAPCQVKVGEDMFDGVVNDISERGCRIKVHASLSVAATVELSFELPGCLPIEGIRASVRSRYYAPSGAVLGCEFEAEQEHLQSDIAFFVASSIERGGSDRKELRRVFIVDSNPLSSAGLRDLFNDNGWEAFVASSSVEGLLRLRMLPPTALLINESHDDMVGIEVLRLLHASRGLEHLRLFVYGGKSDELRTNAAEAGLSGYFIAGTPLFDICSSVIAEVTNGS